MPKYLVKVTISYEKEVWADDEEQATEAGWTVEGDKSAYVGTDSIDVEEIETDEDEEDPREDTSEWQEV